jgi:5-methylcytosine-specific restriction endonuclease McrA
LSKIGTIRRVTLWNKFCEKTVVQKCAYCFCLITKTVPFNSSRYATLDHLVPRCKGGTNVEENLVWCCYDCNNKKADSLWLLPSIEVV